MWKPRKDRNFCVMQVFNKAAYGIRLGNIKSGGCFGTSSVEVGELF